MSHRVIFVDPELWTTPKEIRMTGDRDEFGKAPADVVPPSPSTREQILQWNDQIGATVTISVPGQMISDLDGLPAGMTPSEVYTVPLPGRLQVFRDQLDAAGLTEDDVPNLTIIDRPVKD